MKIKKILLPLFLSLCLLAGCSPLSLTGGNNNPGDINNPGSGDIDPNPGDDKEDSKKVSEIIFKPSTIELNVKSSYALRPIILPTNAENKTLRYVSTDASICSVDETSGMLYGWKVGKVNITAYSTDGGNVASDLVTVNVIKTDVESITLNKYSLSIDVGDSDSFTATVNPNTASVREVSATIDDESVATFKKSGSRFTVEGVKAGETDLVITSNDNKDIKATCHITVNKVELTAISVENSIYNIKEFDSFTPVITFVPSNATNQDISLTSSDSEVVSIGENNIVNGLKQGTAVVTITSLDNSKIKTSFTVNVNPLNSVSKTQMAYKQKDVANHSIYGADACPSIGNPKLLVVPIWFTDSNAFIDINSRENVREDIKKVYFGTSDEVGWRSVRTYYEQDSFNKVSLDGVVTDWYECGGSYLKYAPNGTSNTRSLVNTVVNWYKSKTNSKLQDFDFDKNGYLDGVIMVYAAPNYASLGKVTDKEYDEYGNLWAYKSNVTSNTKSTTNPTANVFFWASYDFMYDSNTAMSRTNKSNYGYGDCSKGIRIDTHTFIHEMGHVFGLNDYYDYADKYTQSGGFSMQDYNVGAHDPYSRIALGWVSPYLFSDVGEVIINPIEESGDVVMVKLNNDLSPFDEYMLFELYTPTGLNEFDSINQYRDRYPQGPNVAGIRVWHVDSRLFYNSSQTYNGWSISHITTNPLCGYYVSEMMCNTSNGDRDFFSENKDYSQLFLIRNNTSVTWQVNTILSEADLFKSGDYFDTFKFAQQFVNRVSDMSAYGAFNSGKDFKFKISFSKVSSKNAKITISNR